MRSRLAKAGRRALLLAVVSAWSSAGCGSTDDLAEGDVPAAPPGAGTAAPARAPQAVRRPDGLARRKLIPQVGVHGLAWSPDGTAIAVAGGYDPGSLRVFGLASGEPEPGRVPLKGKGDGVAWSPDGARLAAVGRGWPHLRISSATDGAVLAEIQEGNASPEIVSFAADGRTLAWNGAGGPGAVVLGMPEGPKVFVSDAATGKTLRVIETGVASVMDLKFSPEGQTLAVTEETVVLRDAGSGEALWKSRVGGSSLGWSPDARWIAALAGNEIVVLESATGDEAGRFVVDESRSVSDSGRVTSGKLVRCMATSPADFVAAVGYSDGIVVLWDLRTGRKVARYVSDGVAPRTNGVTRIAFSPDGRTLAAGCRDGLLVLDVLFREKAEGPVLDGPGLEAAWTALGGGAKDARKGAAWLSRDPESAVPWLVKRLEEVPAGDGAEAIGARLGSDDAEARRRAAEEATGRPDLAAAFGKAAGDAVDPEVRARLREIVQAMEAWPPASPPLRARDRAIMAIEMAGSPAAAEALERLATTLPLERERRAARQAAGRLRGR